jgi:hypothetical protein
LRATADFTAFDVSMSGLSADWRVPYEAASFPSQGALGQQSPMPPLSMDNAGGHMNLNRHPYSSDPSMMSALRTVAITRGIIGTVIVSCIFAMLALSACQQQPVSGNRVLDSGAGQSVPSNATDVSLDTQLRLDPSEIMFYSANVHG